ncbi:MAG TPA: MauE/DoxX family redox-associated membrane protein [Candidatus Acidoferrum sp.]|nr:MauE/DoxX family redox-associated membrane protein [Candidatus Acidoferrum sp.]
MNSPAASAPSRLPRMAALLARCLLGGLFIYLGVSKLLHGTEFQLFVHQQLGISSPWLSGLITRTWPSLETLYGLWLLTGFAQDAAAQVARFWLAAVFIYMGLSKALPEPEAFLKLVRHYHLVNAPVLLNSVAAALPWFEVYCGLLLLLGVAVRGTAVNLIAMLVPFTLAVLRRAIEVAAVKGIPFCAVKFDCGCGAGEVFICHKLMENSTLLLLAAWLLTGRGHRLCLRYSLLRARKPFDKVAPLLQLSPHAPLSDHLQPDERRGTDADAQRVAAPDSGRVPRPAPAGDEHADGPVRQT